MIKLPNKPLHYCNPDKNVECRKTNCKHNPSAISPQCSMTSEEKYSNDGIAYDLFGSGTDKAELILVARDLR